MNNPRFDHAGAAEAASAKFAWAHRRMARVFILGCLLAGFALCGTIDLRAQYAIDWYTIDGGGGTSTGGVYSISGTIGQPDAGTVMTGGNYSLTGGFWSAVAVQTPGAPLLSIATTPTNTVVISWPSPSTGFVLQQNTNLASTNWTAVATPPTDDGSTRSVIVSPPVGNRFYRLQNP
ncbi:MAG: hypothetical protein IH623_25990 [Verrucomicrobia bacterium]|nr:hypothetical protein [Verrucomicrobiota bacterium]